MKRINIADVAQKAGVSPTAVSFAFNKPEQLSRETVSRIRMIAVEMGYMPNPMARALIAQRSGIIGVLLPQPLSTVLANPYFHTFLQGISSMCDEQALSLMTLSPMNGSLDQAIARSPVDGYIIVGYNEAHHEVSLLRKRGIQYVLVDGDATRAPSVNIDDESGAYEAAKYLIQKGHRDILILMLDTAFGHADEQVHGVAMRRMHGYRRAYDEAGVAWRHEWVRPSVSSMLGGEQNFDAAYEQGLRPTALLGAADAIAIGAIQAAIRRGLRVPQDLEVIGYDDSLLANLIQPRLSTVHQPIFEKGRVALELLIGEWEAAAERITDVRAKQVRLPTHLVLRGTTT
ncbi:MAG: LacI family transcriptional regulator [Anaerolineae bacterium]|nr:LacI family transcriptional regulator [Anaerolineae bacterium]